MRTLRARWFTPGRRRYPAAPLPKEKDPPTPFFKWVAKDEFFSNEPHDPIVVGDRVIVGTDRGHLRAYRCKDGEPLWTHEYGGRLFHRPTSDGNAVYFMSNRGLTAAAVADGSEAWATKLPFGDGPAIALVKPAPGLRRRRRRDGLRPRRGDRQATMDGRLDGRRPGRPARLFRRAGPTRRDQGPADRPGGRRRGRVRQRLRPVPRGRPRRRHGQEALVVPDRRVGIRPRRRDGQARLHRQPGRPLLLPGPADGQEGLELQDGQPGRVGRGGGREPRVLRARATATCTA